MAEEIAEFHGARKITSLSAYPIQYHKDEAKLRDDLVERGKKFVALGGVHYKAHEGMAYQKKKKAVSKIHVNGRIMVDPAIHRRINPNYMVSLVRPRDHDVISDDEDDSEGEDGCGCGESDDELLGGVDQPLETRERKVKYVTKIFKDSKGKPQAARIPKSLIDPGTMKEKLEQVLDKDGEVLGHKQGNEEKRSEGASEVNGDDATCKPSPPEFTDDEYLIASPVVLGFSFSDKTWLEFTVSGVKGISWNENAYGSLVLTPETKALVKVSHSCYPDAPESYVNRFEGSRLLPQV